LKSIYNFNLPRQNLESPRPGQPHKAHSAQQLRKKKSRYAYRLVVNPPLWNCKCVAETAITNFRHDRSPLFLQKQHPKAEAQNEGQDFLDSFGFFTKFSGRRPLADFP